LRPVNDWSTEGFDTKDLIEAKVNLIEVKVDLTEVKVPLSDIGLPRDRPPSNDRSASVHPQPRALVVPVNRLQSGNAKDFLGLRASRESYQRDHG
jgi:hypothetical protein